MTAVGTKAADVIAHNGGSQSENIRMPLPPHHSTDVRGEQHLAVVAWTVLTLDCPRCAYPTDRPGEMCDCCMEDLCDWEIEVNDARMARGMEPLPLPAYEPLGAFTPGVTA